LQPIFTKILCSCCIRKYDHKLSKIREESILPATPDLFDDYNEMVIQFGYIALFSSVFPLASLAAFLNNIIEIRTDMYNYIHSSKRPHYVRAKNIGIWLKIMELMGFFGVFTNVCIIAFTDKSSSSLSSYNALLFAFFAENGILILKYLLGQLILDVPNEVQFYMNFFRYQKELRIKAKRKLMKGKSKSNLREKDIKKKET